MAETPAAERQRRSVAARREAGLVPLRLWAPRERAAELRRIAEAMRAEAGSSAGSRDESGDDA
jgi:hypothetical protein